MKSAALLLATVILLAPTAGSAADRLAPQRVISTKATIVTPTLTTRRKVHARLRVAQRQRLSVRRTIGMACVLPPHIQVQHNWPGPQCGYWDNFILLRDAHRYRIVRTFR